MKCKNTNFRHTVQTIANFLARNSALLFIFGINYQSKSIQAMKFIGIFSVFSHSKHKVKVGKPDKANVPVLTLNNFVTVASKGVSESTKGNYHTAVRSFHRFNKGNDIALSGITADKVKAYEWWLRKRGVCNNTISCYLRSLRAIYNKGVAKHKVRNAKPFKGVFTGNERTVKTSLTIDDINRLVALKLPECSFQAFARDVFVFSFCTMGLPPVDLFRLSYLHIKDGKIVYSRHKTGSQVVVPINKQMATIIERYKQDGCNLLFPRFARMRYRSFLSQYNRALKLLAKKADIKSSLSSYSARHAWASMANEAGVSINIISQALGHCNIATTMHYLAQIDCKKLRESNNIVLGNLRVAPIDKRCTNVLERLQR